MVPSTDASKENTCEATFALMPRNESCALPHPCCPVCTGMRVLSDLSGVLQSSQDNDVAHVLQRDFHILEITRSGAPDHEIRRLCTRITHFELLLDLK